MNFFTSLPASNPNEIAALKLSIQKGEKLTEALSPYLFWGVEIIILGLCIFGRLPGTHKLVRPLPESIPQPYKNSPEHQSTKKSNFNFSLKLSVAYWFTVICHMGLNTLIFSTMGVELNIGSGFLYTMSKALLLIVLLPLLVASVVASLMEQKHSQTKSTLTLVIAGLNVLSSPFILLA